MKSSELAFKILELQERVQKRIKKISETKGMITTLQKQFQQLGISDIEEARKKLQDIEQEIEICKNKISSKLSKLEEQHDF